MMCQILIPYILFGALIQSLSIDEDYSDSIDKIGFEYAFYVTFVTLQRLIS